LGTKTGGLLHRDVKPANIIVADMEGDEPGVFLADFGIARPLDDTIGITTTNMTVGTVAYAAPEQLMGETMDGRSDQYALAATTYNLLTGAQLFPHSNPAVVISRHLNTTPPNLGDCRPDCAHLDDVLQIALAKNPANRFPSCSAFAQALADEVSGQGAPSANATTQAAGQQRGSNSTMAARPPRPPAARSPLVWVVLGGFAATILLIGVIGALWRPWQDTQSNTTVISSSNATNTSIPTRTGTAPPPAPTSAAPEPPPVRSTEASAPPTVTATPKPPRRAGAAREASFTTLVYQDIPIGWMPGGGVNSRGESVYPDQERLLASGYKACEVMEQYPNNRPLATEVFYGIDGIAAEPDIYFVPIKFMNYAERYLC